MKRERQSYHRRAARAGSRSSKSKWENEADWKKIEPLITRAVNIVWRCDMYEAERSRFPKDELMDELWAARDWVARIDRFPPNLILAYMIRQLRDFVQNDRGKMLTISEAAGWRAPNDDGETDEEMFDSFCHNGCREELRNPSDIVADRDLLKHLRRKLTGEERRMFDAYFKKGESIHHIGRKQGYSCSMAYWNFDRLIFKLRHAVIAQGENVKCLPLRNFKS